MTCLRSSAVAALLALIIAPTLSAQTGPTDLRDASIEELMRIQITSATRKTQTLDETAAAVYVITADAIRRSGMTTLPDLLRLAPGVNVAQINANKWAVSVRGFNGLYANKLLVLVDGRTVFSRLFGGVLWDTEDIPLDEIERIEVVRGPGGAVWGANAVNGVVNIITKAASAERGASLRAAVGSFDRTLVSGRYAGADGRLSYRAYGQARVVADSVRPDGMTAGDGVRQGSGGGRLEWGTPRGTFLVDGRFGAQRTTALWLRPSMLEVPTASLLLDTPSTSGVGFVTLAWAGRPRAGREFDVRSSFDAAHRDEPVGTYRHHALDFDLRYRIQLAPRHDLVTGAGHRSIRVRFDGRNGYALARPTATEGIENLFAQDEVTLAGRRLRVSVGAKAEHDSAAGWSLQPTARAIWQGSALGRIWVAGSRAVRTPSLQEREILLELPGPPLAAVPSVVRFFGNPQLASERVVSIESGYRFERRAFDISLAAFRGDYERLRSTEPGTPEFEATGDGGRMAVPLQFQNLFAADTIGIEIDARWRPLRGWTLEGTYTQFHLDARPDAGSADPDLAGFDGDAPRQQWRVSSLTPIAGSTDLDVALLHTGALRQLAVDPYTRLDVRLEHRLSEEVSLRVSGQNLLHGAHSEFSPSTTATWATELPRSIMVEFCWKRR